jgi:hypothetical protein
MGVIQSARKWTFLPEMAAEPVLLVEIERIHGMTPMECLPN